MTDLYQVWLTAEEIDWLMLPLNMEGGKDAAVGLKLLRAKAASPSSPEQEARRWLEKNGYRFNAVSGLWGRQS